MTLAPAYILRDVPPLELLKLQTLQRVFLASAVPCRVLSHNFAIRPDFICGSNLKVSLSLSLL
jgi:hypothetical protein